MGKIKAGLLLLCLVFSLLGFDTYGSGRDCVINTYNSQIGVREKTGRNDGKEVEMYLKSAGSSKGSAWCAAFINWVQLQCWLPVPKGAAWSPSWFPPHRTFYTRGAKNNETPEQGDVFGLYFPEMKRIAHVGFVDEWGEHVITVEGNTNGAGSRDGNGVYRKRRMKRSIYKVADWSN